MDDIRAAIADSIMFARWLVGASNIDAQFELIADIRAVLRDAAPVAREP